MKIIWKVIVIALMSIAAFGQSDLQKMVATEKAFAAEAFESGNRTAFLDFFADDGVGFYPTQMNAKTYWESSKQSAPSFVWSPEFADMSRNGAIGYTTGPWELRQGGKTDAPTAYGHFVSIWQRQKDGQYKVALDIGVSHAKVDQTTVWTSPSESEQDPNPNRISAADTSVSFFATAKDLGLEKAYKTFAGDDLRMYREGSLPILGKKNALLEVKKNKQSITFGKRAIFMSAGNLAYFSNTYQRLDKSLKEMESGYLVQVWKFRKGNWQLVLDLFSPAALHAETRTQ